MVSKLFLTVVIPLNNEESSIRPFYFRLKKALLDLKNDFEVIFIDDGSIDNSRYVLQELFNSESHLKAIFLSHRFGQVAAVLSAINYASGNVFLTIDADLQCLPEDIPRLINKINSGFNVVFGYRTKRNDKFIRKLPSRIVNKIMGCKTGLDLKDWGCSFCCARDFIVRPIIDRYGLNSRFLKQIIANEQKESLTQVAVRHSHRYYGVSKYSIIDLFKLAFDFIINYSPNLKRKPGSLFNIESLLIKEREN